jgi:hypothetical protein
MNQPQPHVGILRKRGKSDTEATTILGALDNFGLHLRDISAGQPLFCALHCIGQLSGILPTIITFPWLLARQAGSLVQADQLQQCRCQRISRMVGRQGIFDQPAVPGKFQQGIVLIRPQVARPTMVIIGLARIAVDTSQ